MKTLFKKQFCTLKWKVPILKKVNFTIITKLIDEN